MADLSGIGANMLEFLKARSRRNTGLRSAEAADSGSLQLAPRNQIDLLQFVLDSMAEGVIVCDRDMRLVLFNRGASAIFGADLCGYDLRSAAETYPLLASHDGTPIAMEDRPLLRAMKGEAVDNAQFILRGPTMATERWVEIFARPVMTDDGTILGGMIVLRDISESKIAEEHTERARDLALEAERVRSEFLSNMSHEIRTPLNGIIGMTQLLLGTALSPEQREYAETVQLSTDLLFGMVNDLLDFSKLAAGKVVLQQTDFDLEQVVETAVGLFGERAQRSGVELILDADDGVPRLLRGDPARLQQVLVNLISNAVKFTERGEVVVRLIKEAETAATASVRCEVCDTGIGIAPEAQKLLFQPFSQVDGSTTRKYGGSGLGLAISAQLVERMGGRIEVESAPGCGSVFRFTMKLHKQRPYAGAASNSCVGLERLRLLVIEDNATLAASLLKRLAGWGVRADVAADGTGALEHLRTHAAAGTPYQAAIVDLHSPMAGSVQLMRAVKADPAIGGLWVIATSSPAPEASNGARHFAYADRWLARPIRPSQLLLSLKELLAQRHREQQTHQGGDGAATLEGPQTRHRPTHPMRVLVVEDNAINQKLALNQLRKLGYAADAIDNGPAALDLMARSPYAAVLMDCQMPRMDGYATTAEIRRREAGRQHTIVIAMTAFAHDGARERCFAAGMDDYISKPVRLEALEAALTRWVPLKAMSNGQNGIARAMSPSSCESIDPEVMIELLDLSRSCESGDFLGELIDMFYAELDARVASIREAWSRGDPGELDERAHEFKGSCLSLGLTRMASLCGQIETLGREGTVAAVPALLGQIEHEARAVRPLLDLEHARALRNGGAARPTHPQ
ncbi:MAG TPA: ATP-binding protein [Candidatus Binataceae bacterium]|jgi:signal transduction histidine kinase/DNA-binding response OmpR family regulator/HPt (histidine-containing phosphotransfer) domain-containing protein|nr:ATP-binding protein [Candidatus Binataceae bacterium]